MTKDAFVAWLGSSCRAVLFTGPYDVEPCECGDVNCHGWRLVPRGSTAAWKCPRCNYAVIPRLEVTADRTPSPAPGN